MKRTQIFSRSALAAIALFNISLATSAVAKPIVVTRGPNGAGHVVQSDKIPVDAKLNPKSEVRQFPKLVQKGPGGAAHFAKTNTRDNALKALSTR